MLVLFISFFIHFDNYVLYDLLLLYLKLVLLRWTHAWCKTSILFAHYFDFLLDVLAVVLKVLFMDFVATTRVLLIFAAAAIWNVFIILLLYFLTETWGFLDLIVDYVSWRKMVLLFGRWFVVFGATWVYSLWLPIFPRWDNILILVFRRRRFIILSAARISIFVDYGIFSITSFRWTFFLGVHTWWLFVFFAELFWDRVIWVIDALTAFFWLDFVLLRYVTSIWWFDNLKLLSCEAIILFYNQLNNLIKNAGIVMALWTFFFLITNDHFIEIWKTL